MSDLRREFADRAAMAAYLAGHFPEAAQVDAALSATVGGVAAAQARLAGLDPVRYAKTRNQLSGAVTYLSPYLRHGVISLDEVRRVALGKVRQPTDAGKLVNELGWRDYYQRVYAAIGDGIWADLEPYKTGWRRAEYTATLPDDIAQGRTGLACMDAFAQDLAATGYLHNHARMWVAAYVVHWRRVQWQAGARWFLTHLLDGDPASNNLSWQWVASTFSHKPYIFNRENLERNTGGVYCTDCPLRRRCPLDGPYERLEAELFPRRGLAEDVAQAAPVSSHLGKLGRVNMASPSSVAPDNDPVVGKAEPVLPPGRTLVWVHGDHLGPHHPGLRAAADAPALFVWDDALLRQWQISLKRVAFIYESLLELGPRVIQRRGDVAAEVARTAAAHGATTIVTAASPSPRFAGIVAALRRRVEVVTLADAPFVVPDGSLDLRRFSRYWGRVERDALGRG